MVINQNKTADIIIKLIMKVNLFPILSAMIPIAILLTMPIPPIVARMLAALAGGIPKSMACGTICTTIVENRTPVQKDIKQTNQNCLV